MSDNQKIKALTGWILANPRLSEFKEKPEEKAEALIGLNMTVTPEKLQSKIKKALDCCKNDSESEDSIVKNICGWMNKDASTLDIKCKIFSKILSSYPLVPKLQFGNQNFRNSVSLTLAYVINNERSI